MDTLKRFFKEDEKYIELTESYAAADTGKAFALFLLAIVIGCVRTWILHSGFITGPVMGNSFQIVSGFIEIAACLLFVKIPKQTLESVGITFRNFGKSVAVGITAGLIISVPIALYAAAGGGRINNISQLTLPFILFFLMTIPEELLFRGYIQTRLYGLIRFKPAAVLCGGLLFVLLHIPARLMFNNIGIMEYISENIIWLAWLIVLHIVLNFFYSKYNSLAAPVIIHFMYNFVFVLVN